MYINEAITDDAQKLSLELLPGDRRMRRNLNAGIESESLHFFSLLEISQIGEEPLRSKQMSAADNQVPLRIQLCQFITDA